MTIKKQVYLFLFLGFFLLGFFLQNIGLILPAKYLNSPGTTWDIINGMYSWLNVSYLEFGIVRRALIGTVLSPLIEIHRYVLFSLLTLISILTVCFYLGKQIQNETKKGYLLILLFIFSPLGAMNLGWMFGRFEAINFLIMLVCINLVVRKKLIYVSVLLAIGTLIHEAFVFYAWPLILAPMLSRSLSYSYKNAIAVLILPSVVAFYLLVFGNSAADALGAYRGLIHLGTFSAIDILVIPAYILSLAYLHAKYLQLNNYDFDIISFSPYLSLMLFIFGIDYYRWLTILFVCIIFSVYTQSLVSKKEGQESTYINGIFPLSLVLFVGFPFLGPAGVEFAFPAFSDFLILFRTFNL